MPATAVQRKTRRSPIPRPKAKSSQAAKLKTEALRADTAALIGKHRGDKLFTVFAGELEGYQHRLEVLFSSTAPRDWARNAEDQSAEIDLIETHLKLLKSKGLGALNSAAELPRSVTESEEIWNNAVLRRLSQAGNGTLASRMREWYDSYRGADGKRPAYVTRALSSWAAGTGLEAEAAKLAASREPEPSAPKTTPENPLLERDVKKSLVGARLRSRRDQFSKAQQKNFDRYFASSHDALADTADLRLAQFESLLKILVALRSDLRDPDLQAGVEQELRLLNQAQDDPSIFNSKNVASPVHAMELKRLGLPPCRGGRVGDFTDVHLVDDKTQLGSGSINTVFSGTYKLPGRRFSFSGVFKPEPLSFRPPQSADESGIEGDRPRFGYRSVATTRLAEMMGHDGIVTRCEMAISDGVLGTVSARAPGAPMTGPQDDFSPPFSVKFIRKLNFADPVLRRGLIRLQVMDLIAGQVDRNPGNYFVDQDEVGQIFGVVGIDNDLSWGRKFVNLGGREARNLYALPEKMPPVVDRETFNSVQAITPQLLREKLGGLLTTEELDAAGQRLTQVKDHLNGLNENGLVLDDPNEWGSDRVTTLLTSEPEDGPISTYIRRDQILLQKARNFEGLVVPFQTPQA